MCSIYILHCNHSSLRHCAVLFLFFYSPSSCFTHETRPISFQKPPGTVDKLPYDFNWACIKNLESSFLCCFKIGLRIFSIPVFTPSPILILEWSVTNSESVKFNNYLPFQLDSIHNETSVKKMHSCPAPLMSVSIIDGWSIKSSCWERDSNFGSRKDKQVSI